MIEKIKYGLSKMFSCGQMRIACALFMAAVTFAVGTLISSSVYTVNIFDGENTYTVRTLNDNVTSAISGVELKSDKYSVEKTTRNGNTSSVHIAYKFPVFINEGDKVLEVFVTGGTVADALAKAKINVDEYDFTEPSLDTEITETIYIDYTDIDYVEDSYNEKIPFKTETEYSASVKKGVVKTVNQGVEGEKKVSYTEKFVNGKSAGKTVTDTKVLKKAENEKKIIGTKTQAKKTSVKTSAKKTSGKAVKTSADVKSTSVLKPSSAIKLDRDGNPVNYKSKMTVRATAYTYTGNRCATGVYPTPGYIAVNPKVIPYGTKMYIKTPNGSFIYGYAVAADTGGFIRNHPTGVDLFMSSVSACRSFGVRNVEIYILN